jgi:hypothetical protein
MNTCLIKLTQEEILELQKTANKGCHTSQTYRAACVLLNADSDGFSQGKSTNEEICKVLKTGMSSIDRIKKKCFEGGIAKALNREKSKRIYDKKADGDLEAKIISIACSQAPEGFAKRSIRTIAGRAAELHYADKLSHVSVFNVLKKTDLNPGKQLSG